MSIQNIVSYWDSQADSLARERTDVLGSRLCAYWEEAFSALLPMEKRLRILDAGCGSGFLAVILSKMGHDVIGIDISPKMVQCAYETSLAFGRRIEFRIMDWAKMAFDNDSFDAVVCCEAPPHFQDEKQAWSEFKRVLKRDGVIVVFDSENLTASHLQAQGLSHCRANDFEGLAALNNEKSLICLSGRKRSRNEKEGIPQIGLFHRHIQTAKRQIQLYQSWFQNMGLSYPEYTVLNMISRHSKGVRPSDISTALVIPPQTLTGILAGLQRKCLINRKISERDHRSSVITITESGAEKIMPLQLALNEIEEKALIEFGTEELADLSVLSNKILKSLESAFQASSMPKG